MVDAPFERDGAKSIEKGSKLLTNVKETCVSLCSFSYSLRTCP